MLKKFLRKALLMVGIEFDPYVAVPAEASNGSNATWTIGVKPVLTVVEEKSKRKASSKKSGAKKQSTRKTTRKKSPAKPKARKKQS